MDLVETIAGELREHGGAQQYTEDYDFGEEWRKAARAAARSLGRPVRTLRWSDTVTAFLTDWPSNDAERALDAERLTSASNSR